MLHWLLAVRVDKPPFLIGSLIVGGLALLFLILRRPHAPWLRRAAIAFGVGAVAGFVTGWLVSDVFDVFGIPLPAVTKAWICVLGVGVALSIVNLWKSRAWRKAIAVVCIPVFVIVAATWINIDFGGYRNLRDALGVEPYPPMAAGYLAGRATNALPQSLADWTPPKDQPVKGRVGEVRIPATLSHFRARPAFVYLPPAALVEHPPVLPVIVMLSGQPGAPSDMFDLGDAAQYLNAFAAHHKGLAPIVVEPDQLGAPDRNPMCVDSPLGDAATYVTKDVPAWIRTHLTVAGGRRSWAIAGYSEGGTCAMQFGAGDPTVFQSILSISGEIEPTIGAQTVRKAFHGSDSAYAAAAPAALLKKNAPFTGTLAIFGVGGDDTKYRGWQKTTVAAAAAAGMTTQQTVSPGTAHDWNTVKYVLQRKLPVLAGHLFDMSGS